MAIGVVYFDRAHSLTALLQLSSPALPIGDYSYSQGFEAAVELALVHEEASAGIWIRQQLELVMAQCETPIWVLLFSDWDNLDWEGLAYWSKWFHASRESRELRQESEQSAYHPQDRPRPLRWRLS